MNGMLRHPPGIHSDNQHTQAHTDHAPLLTEEWTATSYSGLSTPQARVHYIPVS